MESKTVQITKVQGVYTLCYGFIINLKITVEIR